MPNKKYADLSDAKLHRMAAPNQPRHPERFSTARATKHFEPARRHRCAVCQEIFECHLCSIGKDHVLHRGSGYKQPLLEYICETCIEENHLLVACAKGRNPDDWYLYDHLTGERLGFAHTFSTGRSRKKRNLAA